MSTFLPIQVPEKIRTDAPLFVAFMEMYYKYLQARSNAGGSIQHRCLDVDIDNTLDSYISEFFSTYGPSLPKDTALDPRNVIKLLDQIYESKGSEKSFKLLFRILFGIETEYHKPSEQILRASGGNWAQEAFITVHKEYGSYESLINVDIPVKSASGEFTFESYRQEIITDNRIRLFYKDIKLQGFSVGATIQLKSVSGSTLFLGKIVNGIKSIKVISPGASFQSGQIFQIPGANKNTIFKVGRVTSGGKLDSIDIVDFGYDHQANSQYWLSSYASIPESRTDVTADGTTKTLTVAETIYDLTEAVTSNSDPIYVFGQTIGPLTFSSTPSDLIEDYLADRALIQIEKDPVSLLPGRYVDTSGHLSDPYIKLQDNYYYQLYSYVVSAGIDLSKYKDTILKTLHPAGLKYFTVLAKNAEINVAAYMEVEYSHEFRLNLVENIIASEEIRNTYVKEIEVLFDSLRYAESDYFLEADYTRMHALSDDLVISGPIRFAEDSVVFGPSEVLGPIYSNATTPEPYFGTPFPTSFDSDSLKFGAEDVEWISFD